MKLNFTKMLKSLTKWGVKHQPEILHALGFAAGASALVLTATGTAKAVREVDEKQPATKSETVRVAAKYYIPAGIAAGVSVGFHVAGIRSYAKINKSLAQWGMLMYDRLNKLEEKNIEVLGEKKAQKIKEDIARDEINKYEYFASDVVETGHGNFLFRDMLTGQTIRTDPHYVHKLIDRFNEAIINQKAIEMGNSRNSIKGEAYYPSLLNYEIEMGERETSNCQHYKWYDLLRVHISYEKAQNGEPLGIIDHQTPYMVREEFMHMRGAS